MGRFYEIKMNTNSQIWPMQPNSRRSRKKSADLGRSDPSEGKGNQEGETDRKLSAA